MIEFTQLRFALADSIAHPLRVCFRTLSFAGLLGRFTLCHSLFGFVCTANRFFVRSLSFAFLRLPRTGATNSFRRAP